VNSEISSKSAVLASQLRFKFPKTSIYYVSIFLIESVFGSGDRIVSIVSKEGAVCPLVCMNSNKLCEKPKPAWKTVFTRDDWKTKQNQV